nr:prolyl oligopeptidase family serine peptidase [Ilumatobacteraceae bacterium]
MDGPSREISAELCVAGRDLTEPRPSPDGSLVALAVRAGSHAAIVVVPVDGGPERVLTTWPPPSTGRGFGGGCFDWLADGSGIVHAAADGELWVQRLDAGAPRRITSHGPDRSALAPCVSGSHVAYQLDDAEIWCVDLDECTPRRLDGGSAGFCFDPSIRGTSVVWQAWDVPDMPWDAARIEVVDIESGARRTVRPAGAAQQPRIDPAGVVWSVRDDTGWLNVWRDEEPLVAEPHEHAGPTWGAGQCSYAWSPDGRQVAFTRNEDGFGRLCVHDLASGTTTDVARGVHGQVRWVGDVVTALRSGARTPTQVVAYDAGTWSRRVLAVGPAAGWDALDLPEPEAIVVAGPAGDVPVRRYGSGSGRVLVALHGGPTDQWQVTFHPRVAFWWSRGWDVLVPDPRGSTGHGRTHQQALRGGWGVADVADVAAVLEHAHRAGWSSPPTSAVLGSSSGGLGALGVLVRHPG